MSNSISLPAGSGHKSTQDVEKVFQGRGSGKIWNKDCLFWAPENGFFHNDDYAILREEPLTECGDRFTEDDADPKFIDLLLDDAFKRAFGKGSGKKVLLPFLRMILPEKDIASVTYTDTEYTNPFTDKHDVRIDVECISQTGERFMVELQRARQSCFIKRTLYYASFAIFQQMAKGRRDYSLCHLNPELLPQRKQAGRSRAQKQSGMGRGPQRSYRCTEPYLHRTAQSPKDGRP